MASNSAASGSTGTTAVATNHGGRGSVAAGATANTGTVAGRKSKKSAAQPPAASSAPQAQSQPSSPDPSALASAASADATSTDSQGTGSASPASIPNDATAAANPDLQSLAAEAANALNQAGTNGAATASGGKTADDQSAKTDNGSGKNGGDGSAAAGTSAAGATPAQTNQQQAATVQPVAAALVINSPADTPAAANTRGTIDPQGNARGKVTAILTGTTNSAAQDAKDTKTAATPSANPDAGQATPANTQVTPTASQNTSDAPSGNSANALPANNAAVQPQNQPQPAGTPAAAFTITAGGVQSSGAHPGQASNTIGPAANSGSGAGGQTIGAAANADANSNVMPNLGVQTANALPSPPGMPTAAAVPVAGLAVEIVTRARAGSNKFDIRLDPPELGRIDVRLDVDRNGQVTSHVTVDRPDTLQLLQSQQPELQRALEQAGLTTTNNGLQFTLRDQSFAGQNGSGNGGQPPAPQLVIPDPKLSAIDTTQVYSRWNLGGGLDIRV